MAFCTKCGKQLSDGQDFCSSCGNKVQAGNNYVKPNSNVTFNAIPKKPLPKFSDIKKKIFPQLKNEKLFGAVTHVIVDDPTKGYGIFAYDMYRTGQNIISDKTLKEAS